MKLLLFFCLVIPSFCFAQVTTDNPVIPVNPLSHKIDYLEVVKNDTLSKEQIYTCVREWFNRNFETGHCVILMDDYKAGHLMARGTIFAKHPRGIGSVGYTVSFTLDIFVKEGKYRYEATDFNILAGINGDLLPDWISADVFVTDPKYKNSKGEYTGTARQDLGAIDGNIHYMLNNLKASVLAKAYSYKMQADF